MKKWVSILAIMSTLLLSACTSKLGSHEPNTPASPAGNSDTERDADDEEFVDNEISLDSIQTMDNGYIIVAQSTQSRTAADNTYCQQTEQKLRPAYNSDIFDSPNWDRKLDSSIDYNALDAWEIAMCIALQDELYTYADIYMLALGYEAYLKTIGISGKCPNLLPVLRTIQRDCQSKFSIPDEQEAFLRYQANALIRNNLFISARLSDEHIKVTSDISDLNNALITCIKHVAVNTPASQLLKDIAAAQNAVQETAQNYKFPAANLYVVNHILNDIKHYLEKDPQQASNTTVTKTATGKVATTENSKVSSSPSATTAKASSPAASTPKSPEQLSSDFSSTSTASTNAGNDLVGVEQMPPSGLKFTITKAGTGRICKPGDMVRVHYTGRLENGTIFDSSYDRSEPLEFALGKGVVIDGWESGITGMRVGEHRHLVIPPALGYGKEGNGPIPANATLIFDVELVNIK